MSLSVEDRDAIIRIVYDRLSSDLYLILQRMGLTPERAAQASQALAMRGRIRKENKPGQPGPGQWTYDAFPRVAHDQRRPENGTAPLDRSPTQNAEPVETEFRCPACGGTSLSEAGSADAIGNNRLLVCGNCRATHDYQTIVDNTALARMMAMLMRNNTTTPTLIPKVPWVPKSAETSLEKAAPMGGNEQEQNDADLPLEKYIPHIELNKSIQFSLAYVLSNDYFDLLNYYFEDPTLVEPIEPARIIMLQNAIYDGLMHGENVRQIADRINRVVKDKDRAMLIARTEVARVINNGKAQLMSESGQKKAQWISAPEDGRLCADCKAHDGKEYTVEWLKKNIPKHCNCRCTYI